MKKNAWWGIALLAIIILCHFSASTCARKAKFATVDGQIFSRCLPGAVLVASGFMWEPSESFAAQSASQEPVTGVTRTSPSAMLQPPGYCDGTIGPDQVCLKVLQETPKLPSLPEATSVPPRAPASDATPAPKPPVPPKTSTPTPTPMPTPTPTVPADKSTATTTIIPSPSARQELTSRTIRKIAKKLPMEWARLQVVDDEEVIDLFQGIKLLPNVRIVTRKLTYKEAATAAALAGATAEVIATGVLYPLDTIKTRLQSQNVDITSEGEGSSKKNASLALVRVLSNNVRERAKAIYYDGVIRLQQVQQKGKGESLARRAKKFISSLPKRKIIVETPREIFRNASQLIADAYRGVIPELAVAIPQGATFFATRDIVRKVLGSAAASSSTVVAAKFVGPTLPREYVSLLAIAVADVLYWVVRSPAQKLQTNLQVRRNVVIQLSEGKKVANVLRGVVYDQQLRNMANKRARLSMRQPKSVRELQAQVETPLSREDISIKDVFDSIDTDNNGEIDGRELQVALSRSGGVNKQTMEEVIRFCDKDGDGFINYKEFQEAIRLVTFSQEKQKRKVAAPEQYFINLSDLWKDYWVLITTDAPQLILRAALLLLLEKNASLGNTEAYLLATSASAVLCTPLDVCRTRILLDSGESDKFGTLRAVAPVRVFRTFRKIYNEEGLGALYSGWFYRLLLSGIILGGFLPFKLQAYELTRTEVVLDILDHTD